MDGGRGQVNIALQVLDELKLNIPVCGMVKDDNHRTRGLYYNNVEIPIDRNSEAFKLITRIQDEAHRFAIEFHRQLRGKGQVHSVLDDIDRDAVVNEAKHVQIQLVDRALDLDNVLFPHLVAVCIFDDRHAAVHLVELQIFVDRHTFSGLDVIEHDTFI